MSHLNWAAVFVFVAVVASMLGFADVSHTSVWVAAVFLIAFGLVVYTSWAPSHHDDGEK